MKKGRAGKDRKGQPEDSKENMAMKAFVLG